MAEKLTIHKQLLNALEQTRVEIELHMAWLSQPSLHVSERDDPATRSRETRLDNARLREAILLGALEQSLNRHR